MKNEILIFPVGKHYIEKYNQWLLFDDIFFQKVLKSFNSGLPKPFVDIDHEQKTAYGEIIELKIDDEGMKGVVNWNEKGIDLLKNKEYRYTSPSFGEITDTNGEKHEIYLDSVSLTNVPALLSSIPKIQDQLKLNRGRVMKNKKIILSQITDESLKNVVNELIEQGEVLEDIVASMEKEKAELLAKIEELKNENETKEAEVQKMKNEQLSQEADNFLKEQIEMKKLNVKHAEYWKKQYTLSKKDVIDYFNAIETEKDVSSKMSGKYKLSQDDITVMKSIGLNCNDEKDIEFYVKSNRMEV